MSHRAHGEGSITQRKDGRWQAALRVAGIRRTVYGKTRKEAAGKLAELRRQAAGGLPDPGRRTVADLLTAWLESAMPTLRPRTLHDYRRVCELYILPALGGVKLARLEPARIERHLAGIQRRGHHRTAQLVYTLLHRACVFAVRWRWLGENPLARVQRPPHRAARKAVWTQEQLQSFVEGTREHWLYPLWHILLASGCRVGELLALTWQDVDFDAGTIRIAKTMQRVAGEVVVNAPKTEAGQRTVVLPADAMARLRQQRGRQLLAGLTGDLVFPNTSGRPLHVSTVGHALTRECRRLGLPRVTPHGLRHLHASLLLAEGLPLPAVSARLGHANTQVTATVYAHALPGQDDGARAIARALGGGR
jgi:integrase